MKDAIDGVRQVLKRGDVEPVVLPRERERRIVKVQPMAGDPRQRGLKMPLELGQPIVLP